MLRYDLVVVGGGPAGISVVQRLRNSRLRIALLEAGGLEPSVHDHEPFKGEVVGRPYWRLHACRFRRFGGSANRWGGMSRPLDAEDFEARNWVPYSGWPIGRDDLLPYYDAAAEMLSLPRSSSDARDWPGLPAGLPVEGSEFDNSLILYSPRVHFGSQFRDAVLAAESVSTLIHANVTDIRLDESGRRVTALEVQGTRQRRFWVSGRIVILAAGGIENARILLAAKTDRPSGLGNEYDNVGRYFMEHPHVPAGHIVAHRETASRVFYTRNRRDGVDIRGVLVPTPKAMREYEMLACSISIEPPMFPYGQPFLQLPPVLMAVPELLYRRRHDGPRHHHGIASQLWYAARMVPTRRSAAAARRNIHTGTDDPLYSLYFRSEQAPNPASRVTLSNARDQFGMPRPRLDWRLSDLDLASITAWLDVLGKVVDERGLGRLVLPPDSWSGHILGGPHHMGTTRMSTSPRHGVVDADSRLHSVENLYVAGGSVFTTSGHAHPTMTVMALSMRLADHVHALLT